MNRLEDGNILSVGAIVNHFRSLTIQIDSLEFFSNFSFPDLNYNSTPPPRLIYTHIHTLIIIYLGLTSKGYDSCHN